MAKVENNAEIKSVSYKAYKRYFLYINNILQGHEIIILNKKWNNLRKI